MKKVEYHPENRAWHSAFPRFRLKMAYMNCKLLDHNIREEFPPGMVTMVVESELSCIKKIVLVSR